MRTAIGRHFPSPTAVSFPRYCLWGGDVQGSNNQNAFLITGESTVDEKPLTVLVVDDDESVRKAMKRLLMSNGYPVIAYGSAEEVLESDVIWERVCLLLDVRLPVLSGFDLYSRLASTGVNCPVIFMTSHEDAHWMNLSREAGAFALLQKPFDEKALLGAIALACGKGEGPATSPD